jgi:hypothetical protein
MRTRAAHKSQPEFGAQNPKHKMNKTWSAGSRLNLNVISCDPWVGGFGVVR